MRCEDTQFLSYKHQNHQKIIQYSDNLTIREDRGLVTVPQEYSKILSQMLQKMRRKDMDLSPVPPQGWWWNNEKE